MALNLEDKKVIVAELAEVAANAHSVVGAEYLGLTAEQMTQLRSEARKQNVYIRVVRNTLARRAVEGTGYECIRDSLIGPLILAFSQEEPGAAARLIKEFAKTSDKFKVKVVAVNDKLLQPGDIEALSKMPTREQAIAMLMGTMKAPIGKFVRTLAEPHAKFVRTVAAVRDAKQAA